MTDAALQAHTCPPSTASLAFALRSVARELSTCHNAVEEIRVLVDLVGNVLDAVAADLAVGRSCNDTVENAGSALEIVHTRLLQEIGRLQTAIGIAQPGYEVEVEHV